MFEGRIPTKQTKRRRANVSFYFSKQMCINEGRVGELPEQMSIKYTRNIHKIVLSMASIIQLILVSLFISNKGINEFILYPA
jgi:hypothetical protein